MQYNQYTFQAQVWIYSGDGAWHFITIPTEISEDIKKLFSDKAKGWGSIPVETTVGSSTWKTSLFPDKKLGAYILPIKKDVRKKENILEGDTLTILLEILV